MLNFFVNHIYLLQITYFRVIIFTCPSSEMFIIFVGRISKDSKPFLENLEHGIFAIRSPHRPNHIGISIVKIERIDGNKLYFSEVDMLNQTPVLDIKPYVKYFDSRDNIKSGWIEKHF